MIKPFDLGRQDEILSASVVVLYKHSPICGVSSRVFRLIEKFAVENPDIDVHQIDVIAQRALSTYIAQRYGVRHESPQVLVIVDNSVVYNDSHFGISESAIVDALRNAGTES